MFSKKTRKQALQLRVLFYIITPFMLVSMGKKARAATECEGGIGVYIIGYEVGEDWDRKYEENATVSGMIYVNKSMSATISSIDTIKLYPYVRKERPDHTETTSSKFPDTVTRILWKAIMNAHAMKKKVILKDTADQCRYESGQYFDNIVVTE